MFKEDKEIKNSDDDTLNRANFAQNLALNIQNYFNRQDTNNCLTIGLIGEWGSGKTSLLNITENYLKKTDIKIIKFNPWIYSSYNQLVEQFFDELIMEFTDSRDVSLRGYLRQYKLKINELNLAKNLAMAGLTLLDSRIGKAAERIINTSSEEKNLNYIKKKLNGQFNGRNVVCIIDDLDRLSKKEIMEMFKLIKIMADFNNMIYLVAFDEQVIAEALKENYGEKYIEKIINVPLYVPSIDYTELYDYLVKHFKRISREYGKKLDLNRLNQFLDFLPNNYDKKYGILYFFRNIRDIKRFINILEFNIELIIDEVNLVDFIVITAIQLFYPKIYDKIRLNEFLLIDYHYFAIDEMNQDIIDKEKKEFKKITDNENLQHILQILFPKMKNIFIKHPSFEIKNENFADEQLLIYHPNHFKAYFKLNYIIKELSEYETEYVIDFINSKDESTIIMEFTRLYKENKLGLFFENIKNRLTKIHENKFFLNFLFNIETLMWEDIFFLNKTPIEELCLEFIYDFNKKNRFEVLKETYQKSNNIILLHEILYSIKLKNHPPYSYDELVLENEEIDALTEMTRDKFNNINSNDFMIENNLMEILYIGEELNLENKNDSIIENLISTPSGILTLLKHFMPLKDNSNFLLRDISTLNNYKNVDELKQLIDENESIKDENYVKRFLEGYKLFKTRNY